MGSGVYQHFFSGTPWSPTGPAHQNYAPWELPSRVMDAYRGVNQNVPPIPPPGGSPPAPQQAPWPNPAPLHSPVQLLQPAPAPGILRAAPRTGSIGQGQKKFVASLRTHPEVAAAAKRLGVPKDWIIAQAALETGWGRSAPGNNLFGIKAMGGYKGPSTSQSTREVYDGKDVREVARFRAYDNVGKSVSDYARLLAGSKRYTAALGAKTPEEFFAALQRGGYATDPNYARTAARIARQIGS